jgi:nitrate/TMAO reductase-like tetraheme cytochrome c subunit
VGGLSNLKRDNRRRLRLLSVALIVVVGAVVVITGAYYFDIATESRYFCGALCHPNRAQYVAQEVSPHADLECGTCHIGPGLLPKVQAKIAGTKELYLLVTNQYERPIDHPVNQLESADVICEQCHTAGQNYDDQIKRIARFAQDETNTETEIDMVVRVGNGREVSAAHWHIDHAVSYIARDADKQDIPWVAVTGADGQVTEYQVTDNPLAAEERASLPQGQMDCLDCHNRATHDFRNPEEWVNELMASGQIDSGLPYVKREAMRLLTTPYDTQEAGLAAMDGLVQFYQSQYPSVYANQEQAVQDAVATLQDVYEHTTFPSMNLTWASYPDNLGHTDFPGCFRCHDGAHVSAQGESIPNNCTLCHSAPIARQANEPVVPSAVVNAVLDVPEPDSHREATFIWDHRLMVDETCAECHGTTEFGMDNSSFCANSVCHGQQWPELAQFADFQHPVELVGAHADATCNQCHQGTAQLDIQECATCHQPPEATHFGPDCASCHTPAGWAESAASRVSAAPNNPHGIATLDCLLCHEAGGVQPEPADHQGIPSESCVRCHETTFVAQVPAIPHTVAGDQGCLSCHQGSLQPMSDFHQGIPDASCLGCHTSQPAEGVPVIPHAVEVGARCLACHDQDRLVPEPASHSGWPEGSCLLCHEPPTAQ